MASSKYNYNSTTHGKTWHNFLQISVGRETTHLLFKQVKCWHGLGPLVPLEGWVTAIQYKVVLSHHLYPMMKHFYPDGSGLLQNDNAPKIFPHLVF